MRLARVIVVVTLVLCALGVSAGGRGEGDTASDEVGLTAQANVPEDDGVGYLPWVVGGLLAIVALAAIGNAIWKSPADHLLGFLAAASEGPVADHLFLHCDFDRTGEGGRVVTGTGYLRNLSTRGATLLVESDLPRGAELRLHVGELPGFPQRDAVALARVRRVRRVDPQGRAWLVQMRFVDRAGADRRLGRELGEFIERLVHRPYNLPVS